MILLLRVKCLIECRGRIILSSASIWHRLLNSRHPLGRPRWYLTCWWSWSMVPWRSLCHWVLFWTPWWLGGLEVRCVDSCVVLSYQYYYFHYLVTQRLITLIIEEWKMESSCPLLCSLSAVTRACWSSLQRPLALLPLPNCDTIFCSGLSTAALSCVGVLTSVSLLLQRRVLEPRKADIQRADLCLRLTLYGGLRHPAFP